MSARPTRELADHVRSRGQSFDAIDALAGVEWRDVGESRLHSPNQGHRREERALHPLAPDEGADAPCRKGAHQPFGASVERSDEPGATWILGAPALGRGVRDDAMPRVPSGAKEQRHERVVRAQQARFVLLVGVALLRQQESGADRYATGAERERVVDTLLVMNSAGRKDGAT